MYCQDKSLIKRDVSSKNEWVAITFTLNFGSNRNVFRTIEDLVSHNVKVASLESVPERSEGDIGGNEQTSRFQPDRSNITTFLVLLVVDGNILKQEDIENYIRVILLPNTDNSSQEVPDWARSEQHWLLFPGSRDGAKSTFITYYRVKTTYLNSLTRGVLVNTQKSRLIVDIEKLSNRNDTVNDGDSPLNKGVVNNLVRKAHLEGPHHQGQPLRWDCRLDPSPVWRSHSIAIWIRTLLLLRGSFHLLRWWSRECSTLMGEHSSCGTLPDQHRSESCWQWRRRTILKLCTLHEDRNVGT